MESKSQAKYTAAVPIEPDCDDCTHFRDPNSCEIVEGWISPAGWCRHFKLSQTPDPDA